MNFECDCAWSPVRGWIVCRACCNGGASCTHILADLTSARGEEEER